MSRKDYARILVHAPSRVLLTLALAFGGGAGWQFVYSPGGNIQQAQRDLDSCLAAYADARSLAYRYEKDITELSDWASNAIGALGYVQRLEALNSAPRAYSSAQGVGLSR